MLRNNKIAGVGLDVFNKEPYKGDLIKEKKVILTPQSNDFISPTQGDLT